MRLQHTPNETPGVPSCFCLAAGSPILQLRTACVAVTGFIMLGLEALAIQGHRFWASLGLPNKSPNPLTEARTPKP